MLKQTLTSTYRRLIRQSFSIRRLSDDSRQIKDEKLLLEDIATTGINFDEVDQIMSDNSQETISPYPKLTVGTSSNATNSIEAHKLIVIQPWAAFANFGETTEPELQLEECVSLGNTIQNWSVVSKKLVFAHTMNRKQLLNVRAFEELKDDIRSSNATAVFFGVELLSGIQLKTLEHELKMPVYDRFTVVLNIFRQHARSKEAKIQIALAELPYIRGVLREIHQSTEFSSSTESLRTLVGGFGETHYHQRLSILKKRESKLRMMLEKLSQQREVIKKKRRKSCFPTVAVVGYTNCGKTSLIKYLTADGKLEPKDQLFATLDVTVHNGFLPSNKNVLYLDTVGFLSRIPILLIEAFSATLTDCQDSDLILHVLDVAHPDHRLQYITVNKALDSLKMPKNLLKTKITVGNKLDLVPEGATLPATLPNCDALISITKNMNIEPLIDKINDQLMSNLNHNIHTIKVENGGMDYHWLRKNGSIISCHADPNDGNYLICSVNMSPATLGRWSKRMVRP